MELAMLCDLLNKLMSKSGYSFEVQNGRIEFSVLGIQCGGSACIYNDAEHDRNENFTLYLGELPYLDWIGGEDCRQILIEGLNPTKLYVILMLIGDEGWESMLTKEEILDLTTATVDE